jgi:hypothetical protein
MFYRDMTRAAPTAQPGGRVGAQPVIDLSMADGAALDALTVYLMRYEHIRECVACGPKVSREDASTVFGNKAI